MFRFLLLSLGVAKPKLGLNPNNFNPLTSYRERSWLALRLRSFPSSSPSLTKLPKSNTFVPQIRKLHAGFKDAESKAQEKSESYIRTNKLGEEVLSNKSLCPPGYVFLDAGNCFMIRNCRKLADKLYVVYRPGLPGKPLGICIPEHVHNEVQDAWFVFEEKRKRRAKRRGDRLKRANKKSQDGKQQQRETSLLKPEGKKLEEEITSQLSQLYRIFLESTSLRITAISEIKCSICNRTGAHKCSSCHSVAYCGTECQETDWPLHKALCKTFALFIASQPRPEGAKLVIILPEEDKVPQLRWVVYGESLGKNKGYDLHALNHLLGGPSLYKPLNRNIWRNINIDNHTVVTQWSTFSYGSRPFNACILNLTAGPAQSKLCGPIAILSHTGKSDSRDAIYQDITLSDFSIAVSHLKFLGMCQQTEFPGKQFDPSIFSPRIRSKVSCLSADASGEVKTLAVQHDHPIFASRPTSLSVAMSLPLLIHRSPSPKVLPSNTVPMNPLFDIAVVALIFDADPSSPDWSIPSGAFEQSMSGSILIVRKDGIKFYGKTCMVVLGFFASYMRKITEYRKKPEAQKDNAPFQDKSLARDRFEEFSREFRSAVAKDDPSWEGFVSPFDVWESGCFFAVT